MRLVLPVLLGLLALPAAAGPRKRPDAVKETAQQVARALAADDFIAVRAAYARAVALRPRYAESRFEPVVRAIGEGVGHKDDRIVLLSIETLGELRQKGSARYLVELLDVPAVLTRERYDRHVAAVRAVGAIRDPGCLAKLEKLLHHAFPGVAVAAAEALERYRYLDPKPRIDLIGRLAGDLEKLENARAVAVDEDAADRCEEVLEALRGTLRRLTDDENISSASDVRAWLKRQRSEDAS